MVLAKKWQQANIMKRVCIIRQKFYPGQKNLRRNAETLVREGYHVDIICLKGRSEKKRDVINGVNVHRLPLGHVRAGMFYYILEYAAFFILSFLKLTQLSLKKRFDVVEVDTMPDFLVFITPLHRLLGSKVILYMYENMPWLFITSFNLDPKGVGARLLHTIEKASASYANRVIVSDGPPYKRVLERHGIPSEKITLVLNVPDNTIFDGQPLPTEDKDHFRLIVVSTLVKRYGVQTLVKAIPLLIKEIPNLMVEIVGEGEHRKELEKMARELGVESYVKFTGWILHDDVPEHIARAHVCIAPMIDDVGAPNKLFEYFALSKPSIASDLPGIKGTFEDGCVIYFQPGNEVDLAARILELYRNPVKRASVGSSGKAFYDKCQWTFMKREYLSVYESLLN